MLSWRKLLGPVTIAVITAAALAARYPLLGRVTADLTTYVIPWYDFIAAHDGLSALRFRFANYSPPYLYLLTVATWLPWVPKVLAIKAISVVFDFLAAGVMFRLVRLRYPSSLWAHAAYGAVLFAPTVLLNGAYWGQCDIIYSTFLLASVYLACRRRPFLCIASLALAFSFKAQAMFLGPFILALLLRREIRWQHTLGFPLAWLATLAPAWAVGQPPLDTLAVYLHQAGTYNTLARNAPNLYSLMPASWYRPGLLIGLAVATAVGLWITLTAGRSERLLERTLLLKVATLSVALMPFLLPKMHERYFFPADLISIGLAFYEPRLAFVPIAFQVTSALSYTRYLFGWGPWLLVVAAVANALLVEVLVVVYLRALAAPAAAEGPGGPARGAGERRTAGDQ